MRRFFISWPSLLELQRLLEISDILRSILTFELNSLAHIDSLVWRFSLFIKQDANNETMFAISVQTQNSCSSSKLLCHKKIQKTFLKLYGPAAGIWNSCGHTDGDGWVPRWSACASFSASLPVLAFCWRAAWRAAVMTQVPGFLTPARETCAQFPAPGFGLV